MDGFDASVLWWLFAISPVLLLVSPVVVGWIVVRLPKDYFVAERREGAFLSEHPVWRPMVIVLKNLVGMLLVVAGVVMLFVPGQGLLTIVMGVLLLDFPGKFRLERWLVTRRAVWRSIQWLRTRAGREAFTHPPVRAARRQRA